MLRGNYPAKVDDKGRVKIPAAFLESLREYGNKFYVTSENGDYVKIYPMKVWSGIEEKLAPFRRVEAAGTAGAKTRLEQAQAPAERTGQRRPAPRRRGAGRRRRGDLETQLRRAG